MNKITLDKVQQVANHLGTSAEKIIEIAVLTYIDILHLDEADAKTITSLLSKLRK